MSADVITWKCRAVYLDYGEEVAAETPREAAMKFVRNSIHPDFGDDYYEVEVRGPVTTYVFNVEAFTELTMHAELQLQVVD